MANADVPLGQPGTRVFLRATKYDGTAHWIQQLAVVSDDGDLIVAECKARAPIFTSRGEFRSPYESRVYFWRNRWYNVFHLARPGCATALWYCNVTTPPSFDGAEINYIDLDLDVAVRPDGCIELLDADEFEEHRLRYRYPRDVIEHARAAVGEVSDLARRQTFPFNVSERLPPASASARERLRLGPDARPPQRPRSS